jgi:hypothetical protein
MSSFNWCHGPTCHTSDTQDRLRGVKGSKVLRTRKVAQHAWNSGERLSMFSYFCSNGCYNSFANKHIQEIIAIAPRTEALETPVNVDKVQDTYYNGQSYTRVEISRVDNNGG